MIFRYAVFILLLIACLPAAAAQTLPLRIGASLPLSGANAAQGRAMENGLRLYFDQLNRDGGVAGREVQLLVRDDGNDPQRARAVADRLADDDAVLAVIGHQFSSVALAAGDVYQQRRLVNISPSASNPQVTRQRPWSFSMNYNDDLQGEFIAIYLRAVLRAERVFAAYSDDAYGRGLLASFRAKAARIGLTVVDTTPHDDDTAATLAAAADVDAAVLLTHTDAGASWIRRLRDGGFQRPIVGPDSFNKRSLIDALTPPQRAGLYVVGPFSYRLASLDARRFLERYRQRGFATPPTLWSAFTYDAAQLIVEGLRHGARDRAGLRDYLAGLDHADRAVAGITGRLYFDAGGALRRQPLVSVIDGGRLTPAFIQLRETQAADDPAGDVTDDGFSDAGAFSVIDGRRYQHTQVVYAGVDFFRVNHVDVAAQRFDVEFFLWLKWTGELDSDRIDFLNGVFSEENQRELLREGRFGEVNYRAFKIKSAFLNPYDLRRFPFDEQTLPLRIAHRTKAADRLLLAVDRPHLNHGELEQIYPEEWRYLRRNDYAGTYRERSHFGDPSYGEGDAAVTFSVYQSEVVIQRILLPYLLTLFLPLALLLLITLLLFLIPVQQFDARLTVAMTALLSVLVFHLAQDGALPNVGYLIKADVYFLITYVLMFALIFNTVIVNRVHHAGRGARAARINRVFSWLFVPVSLGSFAALTALL